MPRKFQLTNTLLFAAIAFTASAVQAKQQDSYVDAMNYVSVDVQGDDADSRDQSVAGSVGLGQYVWLQGSVGKLNDSNSASLGDLNHFDAGLGVQGKHLTFKIDTNRYSSTGAYRQRDVNASVEWRDERFSAGVDAMHRITDNSLDAVRNFPTLNLTNVALHVDETLTGNGYGAHASLNLTDALSMSLGGMSYSYDSTYTLASSTNPILIRRLLVRFPTLAETIYLNNSGLTRSLALLDSSYNFSINYQFSSAAIGAQYIIDKALDSGDNTHTINLSASFFVGDHVVITPLLGQSKSNNAEDINFGGLSVSYNW